MSEPKITDEIMQMIAGDIEDILLEQREAIAWAFSKIPDGIPLSISVALESAGDSVAYDCTVNYPLEPKQEPRQKQKVSKRRVIDMSQLALFEAVERLRPKPGSSIESVTISAGGKSATLKQRGAAA